MVSCVKAARSRVLWTSAGVNSSLSLPRFPSPGRCGRWRRPACATLLQPDASGLSKLGSALSSKNSAAAAGRARRAQRLPLRRVRSPKTRSSATSRLQQRRRSPQVADREALAGSLDRRKRMPPLCAEKPTARTRAQQPRTRGERQRPEKSWEGLHFACVTGENCSWGLAVGPSLGCSPAPAAILARGLASETLPRPVRLLPPGCCGSGLRSAATLAGADRGHHVRASTGFGALRLRPRPQSRCRGSGGRGGRLEASKGRRGVMGSRPRDRAGEPQGPARCIT